MQIQNTNITRGRIGSYGFGFNGMEKINEQYGEGNCYDYGERMYDPRIGRWMKMDGLAGKAPSWSPYRFGLDNPIRYSDSEGEFEIDESTAKAYPHLDAYLQNLSATYTGKPQTFKDAFKEYSQLSDGEIIDMLTYKRVPDGTPVTENQTIPRIDVKEMDDAETNAYTLQDENFGTWSNRGTITLSKGMVAVYENTLNSPTSTEDAKEAVNLWLESTTLHEATHYGDVLKDAKQTKTNFMRQGGSQVQVGVEGGKEFEKKVYGQDIGAGKGIFNKMINVLKYVTDKKQGNQNETKENSNSGNIDLKEIFESQTKLK